MARCARPFTILVGITARPFGRGCDSSLFGRTSDSRPRFRREAFGPASLLFEQAAKAYPHSTSLFANAGTSALQAQNYGSATLNLRRALQLDPDHAQSLINLRHVRDLLPSWVPTPSATIGIDSFFSWHEALSTHERLVTAGLVVVVGAVLGAWILLSPRL